MLPVPPVKFRKLGGLLHSLEVVRWRPWLTTVLLILMVLPTSLGAVRSLKQENVVLELGWEGVVRQSLPNSCGPAVIATLLRRRGLELSDLEIAAGTRFGPEGLSLGEFARVAAMHGLQGHWFSIASEGGTRPLPLPAVVHLLGPDGHFAVLERDFDGYVQLADPARGRILVSERQFEREWTGRIFLFDPNLDRAAPES